ncbi:class F sortase [Candidatus Saccharibacteria bacterium QS_8_54_8]|nr:MAG: class F sortase [Candidatus Saccharibacteria bacterium QS_8_54_8]
MRILSRIHIGNHRVGIPYPVVAIFMVVVGVGLLSYGMSQQTSPPQVRMAQQTAAETMPKAPDKQPGENKPTTTPSTQPADRINLKPSRPVHLRIPAIDVDSSVTKIGKNPDGTIKVPEGADYDKPAWYKHSPRPGQVGPTMIEGHVDSAEGGASVFFRLAQLTPGDKIYVKRADGKVIIYQTGRVREYKKNNFPSEAVYGHTEQPTLRLVTCGGQFLQDIQEYESNTVVFATISNVRDSS